MKRNFILVCLAAFSFTSVLAQDYPGYRSGNYTGVNGIFFNPANIADSRYKFDVNLFSLSASAGNNQASFKLKNLDDAFGIDSAGSSIFGPNAGKSSGIVSADFHGPSVMFNTGRKMAFAITTRARVMANVTDMDGKLINKLTDDFSNDPTLPYTIASQENMRFNVNAWSEYGLSIARVISDEGKHFFKAGVTLKYLAGAANAYINLGSFNGTLNHDLIRQDGYLNNTTGRIATGFGGIRVSDFEADQLTSMESSGFGADIGFVYEFRPDVEKFKQEDGSWKRNMNKYKFKVGVSLLDLGRIKYEKDMQRSGAYNIDITGTERLYFNEINNIDIDDYKTFFNSRPQYFTPDNSNAESSYKVSLPSTLQVDIDYHLHRGWYVSLGSQLSLVNSNSNIYNNNYFNSFTLTPRYEGKGIGVYVPLGYNSLTNFNAGIALRFGPLFLGSGSLISASLGDSKQADVFLGLRFGGLFKQPKE